MYEKIALKTNIHVSYIYMYLLPLNVRNDKLANKTGFTNILNFFFFTQSLHKILFYTA